MRLFIAIGLLLASLSLPVSAQESILYARVGTWSIFSDTTTARSCFAAASFVDGTTVRLGFWHQGYKYPAYIAVANPKWKSLQVGKEYNITLQLDTAPPRNGVAAGWDIGGTKALLLNIDNARIFKEFTEKNQLTIVYNSKLLANLSLAGSAKAFVELVSCQEVNVHKRAPIQPQNPDPFAIPGVSSRSDDPFEL